ncbi:MAG: YhfC family intramembrane metalloprotease [Treponema sp.]|jgi:uncharacterized membrane protein YhfC|nr:YhfC family intramembrane metalloprotease [Treponema sp.]
MQVSAASLIFMNVSALASIGTPIALFVVFYRKYKLPALPLLAGSLAFVLFALILERSAHGLMLGAFNLKERPFIYMVYGALMAGVFEETARFISFNALKKKYNSIGTALSYGIGYGGVEAILLAGAAMINNIVLSVMINSGSVEALTAGLTGDAPLQVNAQITALATAEPYLFLVGGIERIFAIGIHMALSILLFYAVSCKSKSWLYPLAILLHAIVDAPAVLMQTGVIKNIFLVEGFVGVSAVSLLLFAVYIHKNAMLTTVKA